MVVTCQIVLQACEKTVENLKTELHNSAVGNTARAQIRVYDYTLK